MIQSLRVRTLSNKVICGPSTSHQVLNNNSRKESSLKSSTGVWVVSPIFETTTERIVSICPDPEPHPIGRVFSPRLPTDLLCAWPLLSGRHCLPLLAPVVLPCCKMNDVCEMGLAHGGQHLSVRWAHAHTPSDSQGDTISLPIASRVGVDTSQAPRMRIQKLIRLGSEIDRLHFHP